ncbi:glycosyltransferase [Flavobacterium sp. LHD-85]|uniref:glycosyltransferase n=1 Tax=Flavobacterium sp. LHD-85 TaxID=3071410 RepID=UPI0027E0A556|nr:glycosyltransferase [Flavobacterium sp. LHD-85]MDQ6529622.1 glycosyltransferase [Flavobacterium sp. LHD-85]
MKILLVSMPSLHVIRWIENLKDTNFELFWFDVLGRGKLETLNSVTQFTGWKKRKTRHIKGESFLRKKYPDLYEKILPYLEVTANEALEKIILEINPDVVHSFEMQNCSYPILKTMRKFPKVKWLYSCWGSDLFYYKDFKRHNDKIKNVLERVDFLHTDCKRDFDLAVQLNFLGKFLGVIPGGTGHKLKEMEPLKLPVSQRKIILVKGYEHDLGRGLNIVKALHSIEKEINEYQVIIFGSHSKVKDYIKSNQLNFIIFDRHELSHSGLAELMGKSLVYIGNSISDGMPNTLLEAIVMGAFPIQSNPGGVTEEIITNNENGLLIQNPESIQEIKDNILKAISDLNLIEKALLKNQKIASERLDYFENKKKVIEMYKTIMK